MITITYSPPNVEPTAWSFETDQWTYGETVEMERRYGGTRGEFFSAVAEGSDTARQILVWLVRRRTEPQLTLDDLNGLLPAYLAFAQPPADEEPDPKDPAESLA